MIRVYACILTAAMLCAAGLIAERRHIAVIVSSDTGIYADALTGFYSSFDTGLAQIDQPVYVDALPDPARFFSERSDADLIVTIGSKATQLALAEGHGSKIVFSMVSSPRAVGVASRPDVCGTSMDVSLSEFFKSLRELSPSARNVYAFYSTPEGEFAASEGEYLDLQLGVEYHKRRLSGKSELPRALESIQGKADAFYLVPDALYDSEQFQIVSDFCKKNKIVLMTSFSSLMQAGATFSLRPDYTRIGRVTAEMAGTVLQGKGCGPRRVVFPDQAYFSLNERYAEESGLTIPQSVKETASRTRLFLSAVNLMNEGKPKSALIVFDAILKKAPDDAAAKRYRDAIVERQSGAQTRQMMESARQYLAAKNFERAIQEYKNVLSVNAGNQEAMAGLDEAKLGISEQYRARGDAAVDPYDKARFYSSAVQYMPNNTRAAMALDGVRARQKQRLAEDLKLGIADYNAREFDRAVKTFENILLIEPGNREAQEYLRIAVRKRDALRKLQE